MESGYNCTPELFYGAGRGAGLIEGIGKRRGIENQEIETGNSEYEGNF